MSQHKSAFGASLFLGYGSFLPVFAVSVTRNNGSPIGDNQNHQSARLREPTLPLNSLLIEKRQLFQARTHPRASRSCK